MSEEKRMEMMNRLQMVSLRLSMSMRMTLDFIIMHPEMFRSSPEDLELSAFCEKLSMSMSLKNMVNFRYGCKDVEH